MPDDLDFRVLEDGTIEVFVDGRWVTADELELSPREIQAIRDFGDSGNLAAIPGWEVPGPQPSESPGQPAGGDGVPPRPSNWLPSRPWPPMELQSKRVLGAGGIAQEVDEWVVDWDAVDEAVRSSPEGARDEAIRAQQATGIPHTIVRQPDGGFGVQPQEQAQEPEVDDGTFAPTPEGRREAEQRIADLAEMGFTNLRMGYANGRITIEKAEPTDDPKGQIFMGDQGYREAQALIENIRQQAQAQGLPPPNLEVAPRTLSSGEQIWEIRPGQPEPRAPGGGPLEFDNAAEGQRVAGRTPGFKLGITTNAEGQRVFTLVPDAEAQPLSVDDLINQAVVSGNYGRAVALGEVRRAIQEGPERFTLTQAADIAAQIAEPGSAEDFRSILDDLLAISISPSVPSVPNVLQQQQEQVPLEPRTAQEALQGIRPGGLGEGRGRQTEALQQFFQVNQGDGAAQGPPPALPGFGQETFGASRDPETGRPGAPAGGFAPPGRQQKADIIAREAREAALAEGEDPDIARQIGEQARQEFLNRTPVEERDFGFEPQAAEQGPTRESPRFTVSPQGEVRQVFVEGEGRVNAPVPFEVAQRFREQNPERFREPEPEEPENDGLDRIARLFARQSARPPRQGPRQVIFR